MATEIELTHDRIPQIIARLPDALDRDEASIAHSIARSAARRAPRGPARAGVSWRVPGYLASSIEAEATPGGEMAVNVWAFYGVFVEYATGEPGPTRAQPFLEPAAMEHEPHATATVSKTLRRICG